MHLSSSLLSISLSIFLHPLLPTAHPSNPSPLQSRNPTQCDAFSALTTGAYTLRSNQWGANPSEGSQCSTITDLSGSNSNVLSWSTSWSWANDTNLNQVKSFTNVQASTELLPQKPLNQYKQIPTSWEWTYTGSLLRANVAYDTFLAPTCSSSPSQPQQPYTYEVMIWLGSYGAITPLSDSGYPPYGPKPIARPTFDKQTYDLIEGTNGNTKVYTFVARGEQATTFQGDLMEFYRYLADQMGVTGVMDGSVRLCSVQAGTEVFTGQGAQFSAGAYQIGSS